LAKDIQDLEEELVLLNWLKKLFAYHSLKASVAEIEQRIKNLTEHIETSQESNAKLINSKEAISLLDDVEPHEENTSPKIELRKNRFKIAQLTSVNVMKGDTANLHEDPKQPEKEEINLFSQESFLEFAPASRKTPKSKAKKRRTGRILSSSPISESSLKRTPKRSDFARKPLTFESIEECTFNGGSNDGFGYFLNDSSLEFDNCSPQLGLDFDMSTKLIVENSKEMSSSISGVPEEVIPTSQEIFEEFITTDAVSSNHAFESEASNRKWDSYREPPVAELEIPAISPKKLTSFIESESSDDNNTNAPIKTIDTNRIQILTENSKKRTKRRTVNVEFETPKKSKSSFQIKYMDGPCGTPKTIRWLLNRTKEKYNRKYQTAQNFENIFYEDEPLCMRDPIEIILNDNDVVSVSKSKR
jgi:hypothetical protein